MQTRLFREFLIIALVISCSDRAILGSDTGLTNKLKQFVHAGLSSIGLAWNKEFDEQKYNVWVKEQYAYWNQNKISDEERIIDIRYYAQDIQEPKTKLYAYNLLRTWVKLPLAHSEKEIDQEWLKEQEHQDEHRYNNWVNVETANWEKNKKSDHERALLNLAQNSQDRIARLYAYNLLRSWAKLPLAHLVKDIDQEWLKEQQYEQNYNAWVQAYDAYWKENKRTNLEREKHLLYVAQNSENQIDRLYAYNLLRTWAKLPSARSEKDVDQEWLKEQDYQLWKANKQLNFKQSGEDNPIVQVADLAWGVDYNLKHIESNESPDKYYIKTALYNYNFLRELLHKNKIENIAQIDKQWFNEVLKKSRALQIMEKNEYGEATFAQKELVSQAQGIVGLEKELETFEYSTATGGESGSNYIALCKMPDLDHTLAIIYHELGHIMHKDFILNDEVQGALDATDIQEAISQITNYLTKGKSVIDSTSELGKHLLELAQGNLVQEYPVYWIPPTDHEEYLRSLLSMNKERRADLFMLDSLYKLNKIDPIISWLYYFGMSPNTFKFGAATHPSDKERALYMIGFLASKGLDINSELKRWELEGTCTSREDIPITLKEPILTEGAQDVQKIYREQKEHKS